MYNLFGFAEVRSSLLFFHCFGNDIIMTSFLVTWFSNLHILWDFGWTISLPSFNSVRLSLASFIDRFRKHNDDVIMTSFHIVEI